MTAWALAAAGLAGLAVLGLLPGPYALRRADVVRTRTGGWSRVVGWWSGRPGAPALRLRLVTASVLGVLAAWLPDTSLPLRLLVALPVALGTTLGLGRLESTAHRRRREALAAAWPPTWELLACCVAAGLPLGEACRAVAAVPDNPAARVLAGVVARVDVGMSEAQALLQLREDPQIGRVVADLARGLASGTGMSGLLLEHADEARQSHHATLQAAARAVGVRSVLPLMICYLPAFFLIGIVPVIGGAVAGLLG